MGVFTKYNFSLHEIPKPIIFQEFVTRTEETSQVRSGKTGETRG